MTKKTNLSRNPLPMLIHPGQVPLDSQGTRSEVDLAQGFRLLHEVSLELSRAKSADELCRTAVEWGLERFGFDRMSIWFIDPDDSQCLIGTWGTDAEGKICDERGIRVHRDAEIAPQAFYDGSIPLIVFKDQPCYDAHRNIVGRGDKVLAALWDGYKIIGELSIDNLVTHDPIGHWDLIILFARTVAHLSALKKSEESLAKKAEELKQQNETKDKLFTIIAHDLKSPFMALIGLSELLKEVLPKKTAKSTLEIVDHIGETARTTYRLLENLLNWAKTQTRQIAPRAEHLVISQVIDNVLNDLKYYAINKKIQVRREGEQELIVSADQTMVNTVLRNLLSNAVKFTNERGEVMVTIKKTEGFAEISVVDNGMGMTESLRKQLFRVSVNPSSYGTANEKGAGIGMVISKEFVLNQGGSISVESSPGKGSTFRFTLPLAEA